MRMRTTGLLAVGLLLLAVSLPSAVIRRPAARPQITRPPLVSRLAGQAELRAKIVQAVKAARPFQAGEAIPVYRLAPVTRDQVAARAMELANRMLPTLGCRPLAAADLAADDDYLLAKPSGSVKVRAYLPSGFISVMDQDRVFQGKCAPLSEQQGAAVALAFIKEQNLVRLLPGERLTSAGCRRISTFGVRAEDGQRQEPTLSSLVVLVGRELAGRPVIGPGGRVVVFLGGKGEVVGLQRNWREVLPGSAAKVQALSLEVVVDRVMKELTALGGGKLPPAGSVVVERAECGYLAGGKHVTQAFLQPAYALHVVMRVEQGPQLARVVIVPAGDKLLEPLVSGPGEAKGVIRPSAKPEPGGDE